MLAVSQYKKDGDWLRVIFRSINQDDALRNFLGRRCCHSEVGGTLPAEWTHDYFTRMNLGMQPVVLVYYGHVLLGNININFAVKPFLLCYQCVPCV